MVTPLVLPLVCESNMVESDFEKEACAHESKTGRRPSEMLSNARLKKDVVPSLLSNSRNYLSRKKCRKQEVKERHIRLENEKDPSTVQQNFGSTKENQDELVNASATFPVPINLLKQKDLNTSNSLHWNKNEATVLIALYQSEKCLYDKTHKHYYDLHERNEACERIKNILANMNFICTIQQIKDKILSLYSKYAFEKAHKDRCIQAGQSTEDTYAPTMWCFGLLQFLDDFMEPMMEIDIKTEVSKMKPEVSKKEENVSFKINSSFSLNTDFNENLKVYKRMQLSVSNNVNAIKIFSQDPEEKEDIFGEYVASEMKTLRDNLLIYMQTKQAIINILTNANLDLLKS